MLAFFWQSCRKAGQKTIAANTIKTELDEYARQEQNRTGRRKRGDMRPFELEGPLLSNNQPIYSLNRKGDLGRMAAVHNYSRLHSHPVLICLAVLHTMRVDTKPFAHTQTSSLSIRALPLPAKWAELGAHRAAFCRKVCRQATILMQFRIGYFSNFGSAIS